MEQTLIGIGSNLGDSAQVCRDALEALDRHPGIKLLKTSSLYRTEPVGYVEQSWFVNAVALCETDLGPLELLEAVNLIENDFGRVREIRWGPRSLDLDILSYGDRQMDLPRLTVPHPRLHERRFVLVPLVEIAPEWRHPVFQATALELLHKLSDQGHDPEVQRLEIA